MSLPPPDERRSVCAVMTAGMKSRVPQNRALGLEIVDYGEAEVWMRMPYAPHLVGNPASGVLHGGAVTTLLDAACGFATMLALGGPSAIATLDLRVDWLKPAPPGLAVIAHTHCFKITRHVCFVRGTAYATGPHDPIASVAATFARKAGKAGKASKGDVR